MAPVGISIVLTQSCGVQAACSAGVCTAERRRKNRLEVPPIIVGIGVNAIPKVRLVALRRLPLVEELNSCQQFVCLSQISNKQRRDDSMM